MLESIITVVTMIVTFLLGIFAKKCPFIKNEMIPIQNLLIGVIVAVIYWIISKDFSLAILSAGLFTGGTYDIFHNLELLLGDKDDISDSSY